MTQEILLVIPGAGDETVGHQALIEPDTTAADLLRAAKLNPEHWQLQYKEGEALVSLKSADRISDHVNAGEKVFAFATDMMVGMAP